MPTNNSSTGGYLLPTDAGPLEDDALTDFLQAVVVGITGLPGASVRPRWQPVAPNLPDYGADWAAVGIAEKQADIFAYVQHDPVNGDNVYQQEILLMLTSFYGPNAERYANILSMGVQASQNREQLQLNGFGVIEVLRPINVAEQIKGLWWRRIDQPIRFRRAIARQFAILNLDTVQGFLKAEAAQGVITEPLVVEES